LSSGGAPRFIADDRQLRFDISILAAGALDCGLNLLSLLIEQRFVH
jgi:hypothetical protein